MPRLCADEWEKQKPVEGHLRPAEALQQLQLSEARLQRLKEERDNVSRAKEALELGDVVASAADDRLAVAFEELHDLKVGQYCRKIAKQLCSCMRFLSLGWRVVWCRSGIIASDDMLCRPGCVVAPQVKKETYLWSAQTNHVS